MYVSIRPSWSDSPAPRVVGSYLFPMLFHSYYSPEYVLRHERFRHAHQHGEYPGSDRRWDGRLNGTIRPPRI